EQLTSIRWTHPALAALSDPVLSDFSQSRFASYVDMDDKEARSVTVLARFESGVPAILEHPLGAGRVVVFNTSANDDWSVLPRRKSFVPLLDRTLAHLSGGVRRRFTVGDAVTLPLPAGAVAGEARVHSPSGVLLMPSLLVQRGRTLLHLDEV